MAPGPVLPTAPTKRCTALRYESSRFMVSNAKPLRLTFAREMAECVPRFVE